jgi:oxygen-independent coproporphyrinogen-3 oxidase
MFSLYVHIPFCRQRCPYCDFFLVTRTGFTERFFEALACETRSKAPFLEGRHIDAIHFGGGTPSLVPVWHISDWLTQVAGMAVLSADTEITLEANPEDIDDERLLQMRAAGINRLSIGVQAFSGRKLHALGRAHTSTDSFRTVSAALDRFPSVSIDLICGAEGEGLAEWEQELQSALGVRPHHISVYMLTLEEKTPLWRDVNRGLRELPGEELQAAMYRKAMQLLPGSGYRHYEVSNYALDGHHSRYNLSSWRREPYVGFGPGAHSFLIQEEGQTRFANASGLLRYLRSPTDAVEFREVLTEEQRFDEEVFLSLRIRRGLPVGFLRKGDKLAFQRLDAALTGLKHKGWIVVENDQVTLTDEGFLFADLVTEALLSK